MPATNSTTNYELPIFIGTDKPSWMGDWNGAMNKIDAALAEIAANASSAMTTANAASTTAQAAQTSVTALESKVTTLESNQTTLEGALTQVSEEMQNLENQFSNFNPQQIAFFNASFLIGANSTLVGGHAAGAPPANGIIGPDRVAIFGCGPLNFNPSALFSVGTNLYQLGNIPGNPLNAASKPTLNNAKTFTYFRVLMFNTEDSGVSLGRIFLMYDTAANITRIVLQSQNPYGIIFCPLQINSRSTLNLTLTQDFQ